MTVTLLPPILLPTVLDDLLARRGARDALRALSIAVAVPASWLPALAIQRNTATQVPAQLLPQAVLGCVLAALVILILALTGRLRIRLGPASRLGPAALLLIALDAQLHGAGPALAHDPGQGREAAMLTMTATRDGDAVLLDARVTTSCPRISAGSSSVVGRRAGRAVRATATVVGRCAYRGQVTLPDVGRWFVYLSLSGDNGRHYEAWLSLSAGARYARASKELYIAPVPSPGVGRDVVGGMLYVVVTALLIDSVRTARSRRVPR